MRSGGGFWWGGAAGAVVHYFSGQCSILKMSQYHVLYSPSQHHKPVCHFGFQDCTMYFNYFAHYWWIIKEIDECFATSCDLNLCQPLTELMASHSPSFWKQHWPLCSCLVSSKWQQTRCVRWRRPPISLFELLRIRKHAWHCLCSETSLCLTYDGEGWACLEGSTRI